MHNNIMAAGSRDRPPMLAPGRYAQWKSRPYTPSTAIIIAKEATDDSPAVPERIAVETILNMSPENKEHYQSEKEAIHFLLTGIGDEIYSTVDACKIAHDMWITIERLQLESMEPYYSRFYKMMNEMIRNNLTVATMQVNVQFLQQLQPEWSRFVTIVKQNHDLVTVSYHKLFDVLKQYQKKVNEIRAERTAKNANPLALVAATQQYPDPYYQAPKSHKSYAPPSKQSSSTRSNASTKYKGKEIAKPITPPFESAFEQDSDLEQAQIENKDMQKKLGTHCAKDREQADIGMQIQLICKDSRVPTTDSRNDTEPLEKVDNNVIHDSPDMCDNDIQTDQNAKECDDERATLANLTLDTEENKQILKQLKKINASLT
ncbi:hypothetical protein Tco_0942556 [Tanacetum coccineum]